MQKEKTVNSFEQLSWEIYWRERQMILSLVHFLIKSQEHECGSNLLLQISFFFFII
jgi:hypothetical protein